MSQRRFLKPTVILNPRAASGKAKRRWQGLKPRLEDALGPVEARFTEAPNHATDLARSALRGGADLIVAIGGDGTFNEVLNGYFEDGRPVSPEASLALCPLGTGGDFRRSAGIPPTLREAVDAIAREPVRRVDACRIVLADSDGGTVERYFANVMSFGMGGTVSVSAKRNFLTGVSGRAAFLWATAVALLRCRAHDVEMKLDEARTVRGRAIQVALGNGSFQGGGMNVCPLARLDSGLLEVTTIGDVGLIEFLFSLPLLYSGRVYESPKCHHYQATRVTAESPDTVLAEVDGEAVGELPASVEVLPSAVLLAGTGQA